jgi:hypothetical protein
MLIFYCVGILLFVLINIILFGAKHDEDSIEDILFLLFYFGTAVTAWHNPAMVVAYIALWFAVLVIVRVLNYFLEG